MNRLMEYAREMVSLSKAITDKLRAKKGEITDDEVGSHSQFSLSFSRLLYLNVIFIFRLCVSRPICLVWVLAIQ